MTKNEAIKRWGVEAVELARDYYETDFNKVLFAEDCIYEGDQEACEEDQLERCTRAFNNMKSNSVEQTHVSEFWKTPDLKEGDKVFLRRLGPTCPGEYQGVIRGVYACDTDGHPWHYIVEMTDDMPVIMNYGYSCSVFPRGCVDSAEEE